MKKRNLKSRILALATCTLVLISSLMLPIGAEAAAPQAEAETFWDKYPFFNILPLTWTGIEGKHNGTTVTVNEDGSINITGKINAPGENPMKPGELMNNYYDIVLYDGAGIELPQTVTITSNDISKRSYLYLYLEGTSRINVPEGETVTFNTNGKKLTKLILRLRYDKNSDTPNDCIVRPMLNAGTIAFPYQPYSVKDTLLGEGYDKGYQDGYTNGTDDALGINECRRWHFSYDSDQYKNRYNEGLEKAPEWYNEKEKELFALGYADTYPYDFHYTCCANKSIAYVEGWAEYYKECGFWEGEANALGLYDCKWHDIAPEHPTYVTGYNNAYEYSTKYTELTEEERWLYAQGWADKTYNLGFHYTCCASKNQAYIKGYEEANTERYIEGYNQGEEIGFKAGKEEGMTIAKLGNWESLMTSVVQAPVNAFQGLFNFQVLGMDMRTAFGSILAICVLLIIVKKVVL